MGWHHQTIGRGVHSPYRWIVADESARKAISTNADGSAITNNDGLYCKCLQTDTNSEFIISSIDPITWTPVSGGSSASSVKKTIFYLHMPPMAYPLNLSDGPFTRNFTRRQVPNIGTDDTFKPYIKCLWAIREYSSMPDTLVSEVRDLTFGDHFAFIEYLNSYVAHDDKSTLHSLHIEAYVYENQTIDPFKRVHAINRFYSALRGRDSYRTSDIKSIDAQAINFPFLSSFVTSLYQDFLLTAPPPLDNAARTIWFSQTFNKIYCHHQGDIVLDDNISGVRRYYNTPNSTTYAVSGISSWKFDSDKFYSLAPDGETITEWPDYLRDKMVNSGESCVRVSLYRNDVNTDRIIFLVKPIGVDTYHLGFHPDLPESEADIYVEYQSPDNYPKIIKVEGPGIVGNTDNRRYGTSTYVTIFNDNFLQSIVSSAVRRHVRSPLTALQFRFFTLAADGIAYKPSRWFTLYRGLTRINTCILPK